MKILYARVSSLDQRLDRQKVTEAEFQYVVEDKCSGAIPFFDRPGGMEVKKLMDKNAVTSLTVVSIDRLGRDLRDILNTIHYFTECKIPIHSLSPKLSTIDENGEEDATARILINVMGILGDMERKQIRERQLAGIKLAKLKGNVYKGRVIGSTEDTLSFLSKEKNKKALEYLKKGYKNTEAAQLAGVHINTVTKIKKLGLASAA